MKTGIKATVVLVAAALTILSLAGCTGPQGATGPQGPPGPQGPAGPSGGSGSGSASIVSVIADLQQAIVRVDVAFARGGGSGSGSIIDKCGYVLTNYHVVDGARTIQVSVMNAGAFPGTLVAGDPDRDVALVKVSSTRTDFPSVTLGQTSDVQVGAEVYAIGFPLGTELSGPATVTGGIISAQRVLEDGYSYIQTDATINPGNSGGCLFIANGNMVGIPSAGIVPVGEDIEGIGLAIPIDDILPFVRENLPP